MSDLREEKSILLTENGLAELQIDRVKGDKRRKVQRKVVPSTALIPEFGQTMILPHGCLMNRKKRDTNIFVIEQAPQLRTVFWDYKLQSWWDSLKKRGCIKKYGLNDESYRKTTFNLAFPFMVFVVTIHAGRFSQLKVFYRKEPLRSESDYLLYAVTTNMYELGKVCIKPDHPKGDVSPAMLAEHIVGSYWGTGFNSDLYEKFEAQRQGIDQLQTIWDWEFHSQKDYLWTLMANWPKYNLTIGEEMDRQIASHTTGSNDINQTLFQLFVTQAQAADEWQEGVSAKSQQGLIASHSHSVMIGGTIFRIGDALVAQANQDDLIENGNEYTVLHFFEPDDASMRHVQLEDIDKPVKLGNGSGTYFSVKKAAVRDSEESFLVDGFQVRPGSYMRLKNGQDVTSLYTDRKYKIDAIRIDRDGDIMVTVGSSQFYISCDGGKIYTSVEILRPKLQDGRFTYIDQILETGKIVKLDSCTDSHLEDLIVRISEIRFDDESSDYFVSFNGVEGEHVLFGAGACTMKWSVITVNITDDRVAISTTQIAVRQTVVLTSGPLNSHVVRVAGFSQSTDDNAHPFDIDVCFEGINDPQPLIAKSKWQISWRKATAEISDREITFDRGEYSAKKLIVGEVIRLTRGDRIVRVAGFSQSTDDNAHPFDTDVLFSGDANSTPLIKNSQWQISWESVKFTMADNFIDFDGNQLKVGQIVRIISGSMKGQIVQVAGFVKVEESSSHLCDVNVLFEGVATPCPLINLSRWQLSHETVHCEMTDTKVVLGDKTFDMGVFDHVLVTSRETPLALGGVYRVLGLVRSEEDDAHSCDVDLILEYTNEPIPVIRESVWVLAGIEPVCTTHKVGNITVKVEGTTLARGDKLRVAKDGLVGTKKGDTFEIHCFAKGSIESVTDIVFSNGMSLPFGKESLEYFEREDDEGRFCEFSRDFIKVVPVLGADKDRKKKVGDRVRYIGDATIRFRGKEGKIERFSGNNPRVIFDKLRNEGPLGVDRYNIELISVEPKLTRKFVVDTSGQNMLKKHDGEAFDCPVVVSSIYEEPQGDSLCKDCHGKDVRIGDVVISRKIIKKDGFKTTSVAGKPGVVVHRGYGGGDIYGRAFLYVWYGEDVSGGNYSSGTYQYDTLDDRFIIGTPLHRQVMVSWYENCERLEFIPAVPEPEPESESTNPEVGSWVRVREGVEPVDGWAGVSPSEVGQITTIDDRDVVVDFVSNNEWIGSLGELEVTKRPLRVGDNVRICRDATPYYGWGLASPDHSGKVKNVDNGVVVIDFPHHPDWSAKHSDIEHTPERASKS